MPISYTWSSLFEIERQLSAKGAQVGGNNVLICQSVSSAMWNYYPWRTTLKNTVPFTTPLVNGKQDYPRDPTCYRLTRAAAWRTDVSPNKVRDFDIRKQLPSDLYPRAINAIDAISDEVNQGVWRLETAANLSNTQSTIATIQAVGGIVTCTLTAPVTPQMQIAAAVQIAGQSNPQFNGQFAVATVSSNSFTFPLSVPDSAVYNGGTVTSGVLADLRVEFQPYHSTITSMDSFVWFDDSYVEIAQAGIRYKLWVYGEDSRAGTASYDSFGRASYSGQLGVFMGQMQGKAMEEDANSTMGIFPEDSLGGWSNGNPGPLIMGI